MGADKIPLCGGGEVNPVKDWHPLPEGNKETSSYFITTEVRITSDHLV